MELLKHMSLEQQSALLAQLKDYPASPQLTSPLFSSPAHHLLATPSHAFNPLQSHYAHAHASTAPSPHYASFLPHHDHHDLMLLKHTTHPAHTHTHTHTHPSAHPSAHPSTHPSHLFPSIPSHATASDSQYASMLQQFLRDGRAASGGGGGVVEYGREESGGSRSADEESEGDLSELSSDDISGGEEGSGRRRQLGRHAVKREMRTSSHQTMKSASAHPVITVTSPPNLTAAASASPSASSTPIRPTASHKSSLVRPPSIRIPPPAIVTSTAAAGPNAARSPLTPWSPFTPLSPITPITPLTPRQSHQPAAALSSISAPAATHLTQPSSVAGTPSTVHLMPSHPPTVAPLSQSDMSPSSRFILPQPSPLFQQHSYPQTPSTFFSSSALLADASFLQHTPSTPALFHQSSSASNTSASSPAFRNPFSSTPAPLLQSLSMPIGLSPMQSPFQPSTSPYPFPSMSPPAVNTNTRPLPSELIVNPHLATSSSAPPSTSSASSSSSSAPSSTASRKRKLAATLPSSTSEDDSDSDSDAPSTANPSSEPVHNCPFTACPKSFLKPSALKRHVRTHTGERPFVCSVSGCGLSFAERGNLKRHERVHSGLKPFRCDMCGHDFARRCHLMQHMKAKHPNMLLEE